MNTPRNKQLGFAGPFMFVIVAAIFGSSLGVTGSDGTTVAQAIGLTEPQTEFAAVESHEFTTRNDNALTAQSD